jgi:hypothetical protein
MWGLGFGVQGITNQRRGLKISPFACSQNGRCHYRKLQKLLTDFAEQLAKKTGHATKKGRLD